MNSPGKKKADAPPRDYVASAFDSQKVRIRARRNPDPPSQAVRSSERRPTASPFISSAWPDCFSVWPRWGGLAVGADVIGP